MTIKVEAKYVKRSVCECGFPALNEKVPLGKIYVVYPQSKERVEIQCGGCKKRFAIDAVLVDDGKAAMGFLPLSIFEFDEGIAA